MITIYILCFLFTSCGNEKQINPETNNIVAKEPISGIRIAWDHSTLKRVSAKDGPGYNGYARLIELEDGTLLCTYEASGNVVVVKSLDGGKSWSVPVTVAAKQDGVNMAVPDILELDDNSILVCYNPRPFEIDPDRKFGIRTKKSYDGGVTWKDERLLYEAGYQFENGCWEPSAIQLPSGEIQLYFANEGPYTSSSEQNISMLRSIDNGLTWTNEPEIVSFRAGSRDGMPSPLLLADTEEIVVAIEDNGFDNFKPYIIRNTIAENWSEPVGGSSKNRTYALAEKINDFYYAGAPYLRQLRTGETILSYQGTEGRPNDIGTAEMKVVIGNSEAYEFNRKTSPFLIPENRSGLWNSLAVLKDNSVIALTSTNAYSGGDKTEVWMIKGHVIPEIMAAQTTIGVDGEANEAIWQDSFPVFIGHHSLTQALSNITYDNTYLYVLTNVEDINVVTTATDPEENDGITIFLDPMNKSLEAPDKEVFRFILTANGHINFSEGNSGKWKVRESPDAILSSSKIIDNGYRQELAIPWTLLGGRPDRDSRIGLNIRLTENSGKATADYKENISGNDDKQPFTWHTLKLQ